MNQVLASVAPAVGRLTAVVRGRYQSLATRERAFVLVTTVAALGALWDQTLAARQSAAYRVIAVQIDSSGERLRQEQLLAAAFSGSSSAPRIASLRQDRQTALDQHAQRQARLAGLMIGFVAPAQVGQLLGDVLKRHPGMHLLKAESLAPELLVAPASAPRNGRVAALPGPVASASEGSRTVPQGGGGPGLYRHGLSLEMSGSYLDAYAYLRELETLRWRLRWDRVSFEVTEHPIGRLVLRLHTLSTGPVWIGA